MSFVSIRAVFDGKEVRLLETAPVHKPYRVLVTFIEPDFEEAASNLERFWASFGAWKDDRSVEATLREIHKARRSKIEPPVL